MDTENIDVVTPAEPEEETKRRKGFLAWLRDLPARLRALTQRQRLIAAIAAVGAALLIALSILAWYLIFRQPISELPGLNVTVPPTYSYSVSGISRPLGVAVDETNNRMYVTQSDGARTVKVFDLEGNALGQLKAPSAHALHSPAYVAVSRSTGNVFVTDRGTNQVYVYDKTGRYLRLLKPKGEKLWGPLAIAIGSDDEIYVSDAGGKVHFVWVLEADGTVIRTFGRADGLAFPNGIALRDDGSIVLSDSNNGRIFVYGADGSMMGAIARGEADAPIGMPRGVAVGAGGRVYVVDTSNDVVRIYRSGAGKIPEYAASFGEMGSQEGQFLFPNGIASDDHGHIYVTDSENNRLQVWTNR